MAAQLMDVELSPRGVRTLVLHPGGVQTGLTKHLGAYAGSITPEVSVQVHSATFETQQMPTHPAAAVCLQSKDLRRVLRACGFRSPPCAPRLTGLRS